jgi:hypothetical protein
LAKNLSHERPFLKDNLNTKSERNSRTQPLSFVEFPSQLTRESFLGLVPLTELHNALPLSSKPSG